jgi:two-component sensor histidine kinase
MAFHELSTNSLKYGALSTPGSQVRIEWERGDERCPFTISWVETGAGNGKPLAHKGFGSAVIVDMVESVLDAAVEVSLSDGEFAWKVKARSRKGLAD